MYRKIFIFIILSFIYSHINAQLLPKDSLKKQPVYTSLEAALKEPEKVYRLHLKWIRMDSLPAAIFTLTHLQELSVTNCKLSVLNQDIYKFNKLQYLTLYKNRLVRLPNEFCDLSNLCYVDINRNLISELPEDIGYMYNLQEINAWGNYLLVLPVSITLLKDTLKKIDLRQISFRKEEIEAIEKQLPKTEILYTNICDCKNSRK